MNNSKAGCVDRRRNTPGFYHGFFVFAMILGLTGPLLAEPDQDEELGKYLEQHGYSWMPFTTLTDKDRQTVTASINGKEVRLVLDTGCPRTTLTRQCAKDLGLDVHDSGEAVYGVGGKIKGEMGTASVRSFTFNGYGINRTSVIEVLPGDAYTAGLEDGVLGFDCLFLNSVLLPVDAGKFLFKSGSRPQVAIDVYMKGLGFTPIPMHYRGGMIIEGRLDGVPLRAMVDSGASVSIFDLDFVNSIGGIPISGHSVNMIGFDGKVTPVYPFTPRALEFGSLTLPPTRIGTGHSPLFGRGGFNALLGYETLVKHQTVLDFGYGVLWMK